VIPVLVRVLAVTKALRVDLDVLVESRGDISALLPGLEVAPEDRVWPGQIAGVIRMRLQIEPAQKLQAEQTHSQARE
jgi:hypothetical protein